MDSESDQINFQNVLYWILGICIISYGIYVVLRKIKDMLESSSSGIKPLVREGMVHKFVEMGKWTTHYLLSGPPRGELVICLHGISSGLFTFDEVEKFLVGHGYQVLRFDFYGRGYSDSPHARYTPEFLSKQLEDLLVALHLDTTKCSVIGHSMGGAVATTFAVQHPEKVYKVVLLAPAGFPTGLDTLIKITRTIPIISDILFYVVVRRTITSHPRRPFSHPDKYPHVVIKFHKKIMQQLEDNPGFLRCYLSTVRNFPLNEMSSTYKRLHSTGLPTLVLWGEEDQIVPFKNIHSCKRMLPNAHFVALQEIGHQLILEEPVRVSQEILNFLQK